MSKEEAIRDAFKPYMKQLENKPVLVLLGKEAREEAIAFWGEAGAVGKLRKIKVAWIVNGNRYLWKCTVERFGDGWKREEEQTVAEATVESFWGLIADEAKLFKDESYVVMMSTPEVNETCRKVCKKHGIKCLTWSQKIGLIADGFEKENRTGA